MVGFDANDDAAIWKITDDIAAVLTADFFTPIVDDPYEFGRIAAANALSDIYAMGATPHMALNLLALDRGLGTQVAADILRGGADATLEAHAFVTGGHTIEDPEPKYGMCVFGTVNPKNIVSNSSAKPGDVLYLTKPLGTALMVNGHKKGFVSEEDFTAVKQSMMELNKAGAMAFAASGVHAATDITGFGLAGHLHELLLASHVSATLITDDLPVFKGLHKALNHGTAAGRCNAIIDMLGKDLIIKSSGSYTAKHAQQIVCDPQTSGGLLVALAPEQALIFEETFASLSGRKPWKIGTLSADSASTITLV